MIISLQGRIADGLVKKQWHTVKTETNMKGPPSCQLLKYSPWNSQIKYGILVGLWDRDKDLNKVAKCLSRY